MGLEDDKTNLSKQIHPFLEEICKINQKYNFSHRGRSEEDEARSRVLEKEISRLNDEFHMAHPMPPCSMCGEERFALFGDSCLNPDCSKWLPPGG